jgi:hypothetical protein
MVQEATISRMIRTITLFAISLWLSAGTVPSSNQSATLPAHYRRIPAHLCIDRLLHKPSVEAAGVGTWDWE